MPFLSNFGKVHVFYSQRRSNSILLKLFLTKNGQARKKTRITFEFFLHRVLIQHVHTCLMYRNKNSGIGSKLLGLIYLLTLPTNQ